MNVNGVGNELGEFAADDLPELGELKIDSPSAQSAVELRFQPSAIMPKQMADHLVTSFLSRRVQQVAA